MHYLDLTLDSPPLNLALDEALLDECEERGSGEVLRFWESSSRFVVLGYSNHINTEVRLEACRRLQIPVLRRASGGGTVLQGPGCLNYALILHRPSRPELAGLNETNCFILRKHSRAFSPLLPEPSADVHGISDLTLGGLKFSGNAQRRRKDYLLFHGTFLYDFDLSQISETLRFPSRQPDYRRSRPHSDFLCNVPLSAQQIKNALLEAWQADQPLDPVPYERTRRLSEKRYSQVSWNEKF